MTRRIVTMRLRDVFDQAIRTLEKAGVSSAVLNAEVLLFEALGLSRAQFWAEQSTAWDSFDAAKRDLCLQYIQRRGRHEPVAYIVGHKEFYGRSFIVETGVLIPRPETEHIVDEVIKSKADARRVLDIGSGSGCVGLTLALELKARPEVICVEKSVDAFGILKKNAARYKNARAQCVLADFSLWAAKQEEHSFDVVVSNPPYIAELDRNEIDVTVVHFEPSLALFGGRHGHETWSLWLPQMLRLTKPGGLLLFEIGYDQGDKAKAALQGLGVVAQIIKDYSGHDRVVRVIKS